MTSGPAAPAASSALLSDGIGRASPVRVPCFPPDSQMSNTRVAAKRRCTLANKSLLSTWGNDLHPPGGRRTTDGRSSRRPQQPVSGSAAMHARARLIMRTEQIPLSVARLTSRRSPRCAGAMRIIAVRLISRQSLHRIVRGDHKTSRPHGDADRLHPESARSFLRRVMRPLHGRRIPARTLVHRQLN
jgi:hypothetical protein